MRLYKTWVEAVPKSKVYPSGGLFFTSRLPIAPLAPLLLSTTTGFPNCIDKACAYWRAN